jgi:hypothetical protein
MSHESVDSWESRIEQVAKILGKTPTEVEEILNAEPFRITSDPNREAMLADEEVTPFGDLRKMFCDENGVSLPQLRMCMKVLRGPKGSTKATEMDTNVLAFNARYGLETTVEDLDIDQILEFYNPRKRNRIHELIRDRYENTYGPVIAFKPDSNKVALEETLDYIADLESGLPVEESIEVDGEPVRLYRVGEVPNQKVDEDPLFPGTPLRRDRSTVNRVNWKDISLETRQFFRILVEDNFIDPEDRVELRKVIRLDLKELKEIFPEAYLTFKELGAEGDLPKLKMSAKSIGSSRTQNPFAIKRNRVR